MARATLCNCLRVLLLALISSNGSVEARPVVEPAHSTSLSPLSIQLGLNSGSHMEPRLQAASSSHNLETSPANDIDLELGLSLRPSQLRALPKQGAPIVDQIPSLALGSSYHALAAKPSHGAVVVPEVTTSQLIPVTSSLDWLIGEQRPLEEGQGSGEKRQNKKIKLSSQISYKQKQSGEYHKRRKQVSKPAQREILKAKRRQNWENLDAETKKIKNAASWQSELRRRARLSAEELQKYLETRSKYHSDRNKDLPADEKERMLKRKRDRYYERKEEKRAEQANHQGA